MFIHTSATLNPIVAFKAIFSNKNKKEEKLKYFSFARGALITAIESIRINNNISDPSSIWLPAFICDTVVIILKEYSVNCKYYKVTDNLEPDFTLLEAENIKPNDFLLLVHYFGFSISQEETVRFCHNKNIFLIEDCAHSIVKNIGKSKIGTQGDAGIFGLRKALPIPNGGVLFLKKGQFFLPKTLYSYPSEYRGVLKMVVQWFFQKMGRSWKIKSKHVNKDDYPVMPKNYYYFDCQETIGKWSEKIINTVELNNVVAQRRENYQMLFKELSSVKSIKIPKPLNLENEEIAPWIFFFYHKESERIINMLRDNGISASTFPTLPEDVFDNPVWRTENKMYRESVTLPVHQDVTKDEIKKIIKLVLAHA
ncbi:DegT/DnrJ/EryC1/StrS family aminotransferase [Candidatus Njordibacter sp. Uisw_039]|uniref:DegT/DnrJ/EryC1/StrS family aminotransferase n=1 Tax=Candidatus Njordibacter sp. Uisw_039 TaxID=3230972 RepID=UPI003D3E72CD